jgi:hypothetical protein
LFARVGTPVILVITVAVIGGVISRHPGLIGSALIAGAIAAAIIGIELSFVLRAIRRRQQHLLASSPAGTLFAAQATPVRPADGIGGRPRRTARRERGLLRIDDTGATFANTQDRPPRAPMTFPWDQVSRIEITPRSPWIADLELVSAFGQTVCWRVQGVGQLTDTLLRLQGHWNRRQ